MAGNELRSRRDRLSDFDVATQLTGALAAIDAHLGAGDSERASALLSQWEALLAFGLKSLSDLRSVRSRRGYRAALAEFSRAQECRRVALTHLAHAISNQSRPEITRLGPLAKSYARDVARFARSFRLVIDNRPLVEKASRDLASLASSHVPALSATAMVRKVRVDMPESADPERLRHDIERSREHLLAAQRMREQHEKQVIARDNARDAAIEALGKEHIPAEVVELRSLRQQTAIYRQLLSTCRHEERLAVLRDECARVGTTLERMCTVPAQEGSRLFERLAQGLRRPA